MLDYERVMDASARPTERSRPLRPQFEFGPGGGFPSGGLGLRRGSQSPTFAAGSLTVLLGFAALLGVDLAPLDMAVQSVADQIAGLI